MSEEIKKIETRLLPVRLTVDEMQARGEALAGLVQEYDVVEDDKKTSNSVATDRLKEIREEMGKLKTIILNQTEPREVEIFEKADYQRGMMDIFRCDDGTQVDSRPLSRAEMQQEINFGLNQIQSQIEREDKQEISKADAIDISKSIDEADKALQEQKRKKRGADGKFAASGGE